MLKTTWLKEPSEKRPPRVDDIISTQAAFFGVTRADILGRSRVRFRSDGKTPYMVIEARHSAMRRCRDEITINGKPASFPRIGDWFGRDHSTVISAYYGQRGHNRSPALRKAA